MMHMITFLLDQLLLIILIGLLLGTGLFLTIRLGFLQFRKFFHGIAIVSGFHDSGSHHGEVSHFQALTTALSATVGIGNIAGVAIAIHWGGPGAIFWMWVTAALGMITKYAEVTLAQQYRKVDASGNVAGGPMYYIEYGLGKRWRPIAMFTAFFLMITAFLSGNAIQANTISDMMFTEFAIPTWISGIGFAILILLVIMGGIRRIGKVTSILAPLMAICYVIGGLTILMALSKEVLPAFTLIFKEAFNPTAGVAGTGTGLFLQTLTWGVRRGLFSNEAGQGSAPIAHAAAKTDHPVKEGLVALLEPFIDTIVICTITALVIITTQVWNTPTPTTLYLASSDLEYALEFGSVESYQFHNGVPYHHDHAIIWHDVPVDTLYIDPSYQRPFTGEIFPNQQLAVSSQGDTLTTLNGFAMENSAPLTKLAFEKGLGPIGGYIVLLSVLLFGLSTAISWSYYGDRCVAYLMGEKMIFPYRIVYAILHFVGAVTALNFIWDLGDTTLALVTIPNVISILWLFPKLNSLTNAYFNEKRD